MALGNKRNIIVGAASVFIGPSGQYVPGSDPVETVAPDAVDGTSYRDTLEADADWSNVGYTQDGLEISTDPSYGEVEVDQLLDAAVIFKDGMGLSISTTFAEATLENLLIAWGQSGAPVEEGTGATATRTIDIEGGNLGEAPLERGLIAVGNAPRAADSGAGINNYGERTYHAYRVLSVESTAVSLARADASTIPVTFRALPEDNGKYGIVRDRAVS